jgi:FAD-dependent urate hydroxylase
MTDLDTTVVGAGPYGLSIAAHLRAARLPFQLFGTPLESWSTFMPVGMVLKSERFASNLWDPDRRFTLKNYSAQKGLPYQAVGDPLSLALFLEYAEWFRQHAVGQSRDVKIVRIRRVADGFSVDLADGTTFTSRRVILATGHMAFCTAPEQLSQLPEPYLLHSTRIKDVKAYAGRDVTIIGAGQSGLETATLLHEAGARHVRVLVRGSQVAWNSHSNPRPLLARILSPDAGVASGWKAWIISEMPRTFRWYFPMARRHRIVKTFAGPSGAWWLRSRAEGRIDILCNHQVRAAKVSGSQVSLTVQNGQNTTEVLTDHVIAATGFKIDVERLAYLDPALRQSIQCESPGIPALDSSFGTSVPGLSIVGIASAPVFGPIMRFMFGAKHVAPILTKRLKLGA